MEGIRFGRFGKDCNDACLENIGIPGSGGGAGKPGGGGGMGVFPNAGGGIGADGIEGLEGVAGVGVVVGAEGASNVSFEGPVEASLLFHAVTSFLVNKSFFSIRLGVSIGVFSTFCILNC